MTTEDKEAPSMQVASQSRLTGIQVGPGHQMQARLLLPPKNGQAQDETDS